MSSTSSVDTAPDRERPPGLVHPVPAATQPLPRRRLATATPPPPPALVGLAALIDSVVRCLDGASAESLDAAIARCNAAVETGLEAARVHGAAPVPVEDELRELALLLVADVTDATAVMRRLRRVLGRLDAQRRR